MPKVEIQLLLTFLFKKKNLQYLLPHLHILCHNLSSNHRASQKQTPCKFQQSLHYIFPFGSFFFEKRHHEFFDFNFFRSICGNFQCKCSKDLELCHRLKSVEKNSAVALFDASKSATKNLKSSCPQNLDLIFTVLFTFRITLALMRFVKGTTPIFCTGSSKIFQLGNIFA